VAAFNGGPFDITLVDLRHKVAEYDFFFRRMGRHTEQIEEENHEQADHDPKEEVLDPGIHPDLLVEALDPSRNCTKSG
jgi:hypothetical protein